MNISKFVVKLKILMLNNWSYMFPSIMLIIEPRMVIMF